MLWYWPCLNLQRNKACYLLSFRRLSGKGGDSPLVTVFEMINTYFRYHFYQFISNKVTIYTKPLQISFFDKLTFSALDGNHYKTMSKISMS
jgi:hypothetical protein